MQHENRPQGEALKQASLERGAGARPLPGASQAAKRQRAQEAIRAAGMLPVLVLLCLGFHFMSDGRFFTGQNLGIVLQQAAVNTVLAAGMTFVILTGGIDLSVGSILAASAMAGLIVSLIPDFASLWIVVSVATGLAFGLINGALIASLRLPPFIVTLGSLTAVRGLARLFGADTTVFNPSIPFAFIGNGSLTIVPGILSIPWLSVVALIVILASWLVLRRTVLGVHIYAVGGNESAARLAGIKVPAVLAFVYGVSGLLAGLGGAMQAARLYAANGLQLGQSYELDAITAVILGGTSFVGGIGSIWGTLVGALIIAVLSNGLILTGVSDVWQYVIKGLVIIAAVALDRYRLHASART
jgi:ribose transport system permease protein